MNKEIRDAILALIKREVVPAIGCTEPVAVALAVAKAREVLGEKVVKAELFLSRNILKNSMGVGIPGTGMIGLPIAIALGIVAGKSEYGLEVLKDLNPEILAQAKDLVAGEISSVHLKEEVPDKLYIEAHCYGENGHSEVIICGSHNHIAFVEANGEVLLDEMSNGSFRQAETNDVELTFDTIYDFATETPLAELEFILEAAELNKSAAKESL
jgi:L-cysteine desulfidase